MTSMTSMTSVRHDLSGRFSPATGLAQDPTRTGALGAAGDDPESIAAAAREFESLMLEQMMKSMRATVSKSGLADGGFGGGVFEEMLDAEYARVATTKGGIGLAGLIARQMGAEPEPWLAGSAPPAAHGVALRRLTGRPSGPGEWLMPTQGSVSSEFGLRRLTPEVAPRLHAGVDIAAPAGTPIRAARAGTVEFAGPKSGYGRTVIIDHGRGISTLYAHARELLVEAGTPVKAGAEIARVGSTGRSTGPHLHFELRRGGRAVDPSPFLGLKPPVPSPHDNETLRTPTPGATL